MLPLCIDWIFSVTTQLLAVVTDVTHPQALFSNPDPPTRSSNCLWPSTSPWLHEPFQICHAHPAQGSQLAKAKFAACHDLFDAPYLFLCQTIHVSPFVKTPCPHHLRAGGSSLNRHHASYSPPGSTIPLMHHLPFASRRIRPAEARSAWSSN